MLSLVFCAPSLTEISITNHLPVARFQMLYRLHLAGCMVHFTTTARLLLAIYSYPSSAETFLFINVSFS